MYKRVLCFDLDDTLLKEIEYLKSAYMDIAFYAVSACRECSDSASILSIKAYDEMLTTYQKGENAFEQLNAYLGLQIDLKEYLQIYRSHKPMLSLSEDADITLKTLKTQGCVLGLITDGRSLQQRNKINALGLYEYFEEENIVISEEFGSEKPAFVNYEYFMKRYPKIETFVYVGDNPKKDFLAPNQLGWQTICLLDNGQNIHKQDFDLPETYLPKERIYKLSEVV
jgi:putative hydrolase of the HAD superfamily